MSSSLPGIQLKGTEIRMQLYPIKNEVIDLLTELRGFKFMATLVSLFEKLKLFLGQCYSLIIDSFKGHNINTSKYSW